MADNSPLPHGRVSAEELRGLLRPEQTLRLEFKKKYDLTGPERGQRLDELAKDLLALLNTAGRHADDYAYLILGAGDELQKDWTRDYGRTIWSARRCFMCGNPRPIRCCTTARAARCSTPCETA